MDTLKLFPKRLATNQEIPCGAYTFASIDIS